MAIGSTMMNASGSTASLMPASSSTGDTSSMGTAGQNMDAQAAKLYEALSKPDPWHSLVNEFIAQLGGGQAAPTPAPPSRQPLDATGSSHTTLQASSSTPPSTNPPYNPTNKTEAAADQWASGSPGTPPPKG